MFGRLNIHYKFGDLSMPPITLLDSIHCFKNMPPRPVTNKDAPAPVALPESMEEKAWKVHE
jgi:hypothetical protein